ncbi:hypothetical protein K474DRAFT_1233469 [Panus rudis PR-1116 ss-1]|nr:hypothetical protein K474DRAFT_1233469 [Panus rudis PR-1116 ss-1]
MAADSIKVGHVSLVRLSSSLAYPSPTPSTYTPPLYRIPIPIPISRFPRCFMPLRLHTIREKIVRRVRKFKGTITLPSYRIHVPALFILRPKSESHLPSFTTSVTSFEFTDMSSGQTSPQSTTPSTPDSTKVGQKIVDGPVRLVTKDSSAKSGTSGSSDGKMYLTALTPAPRPKKKEDDDSDEEISITVVPPTPNMNDDAHRCVPS